MRFARSKLLTALCKDEILGWKIAATRKLGQEHIGIKETLAGKIFAK